MSTGRVVFAAALVAAAWTTAVGGIIVAGAAKADAAWLKSGPGRGFAAAGMLPATGVVQGAVFTVPVTVTVSS
ncbi:hypothetical protein ABJI51_13800 [Amycolatopsis sp. NEAU-NG30]|uniref:Uncharacterized protein n=1 Tax=Amycolatopsis melonis TaxID=3156488 RepID=A0ABV0LCY6_9PSEU